MQATSLFGGFCLMVYVIKVLETASRANKGAGWAVGAASDVCMMVWRLILSLCSRIVW